LRENPLLESTFCSWVRTGSVIEGDIGCKQV
jgi:hypothetical protein